MNEAYCCVVVGTPLTGQMDSLSTLQGVCKEHNIWLHVTGPSLSALSLVSASAVVSNTSNNFTMPMFHQVSVVSRFSLVFLHSLLHCMW